MEAELPIIVNSQLPSVHFSFSGFPPKRNERYLFFLNSFPNTCTKPSMPLDVVDHRDTSKSTSYPHPYLIEPGKPIYN